MKFFYRVEVADVTAARTRSSTCPAGSITEVPDGWPVRETAVRPRRLRPARPSWSPSPSAAGPADRRAGPEALRIEAHRPRLGLETDHRTIPHELGWLDTAVHLQKGCYRGQETVARVHNLGRPPRRLVFLHLDGSEVQLPGHGAAVRIAADGRRRAARSASSPRPPATTSWARSRWPWSSATSRRTRCCWPTTVPGDQEVVVAP